eukprot:TRINITY_DN5320_c0_g1_i1.p1 TRINITY_DN5320_c0_g1~~TRINITY_DN5320_c0_g1_i1.p1  ORF type:complete len:580 (-),score=107.80 TRINITY_DN5320_c0_g1_i1:367-2106(-)
MSVRRCCSLAAWWLYFLVRAAAGAAVCKAGEERCSGAGGVVEEDEMHESPLYNTPIPKKILTASEVHTRLGTFNFTDGIPDEGTVDLAYDTLEFNRAINVFLNWIPAASLHALYAGWQKVGGRSEQDWGIASSLLDSNGLFLTGNMDTVYAWTFVDLQKGPAVIEVPAGMGPSTVDDAYFRFVVDMGAPGPDRGKGGKYLLIGPPATYEDLPGVATVLKASGALQAKNGDLVRVDGEDYFVAHSKCYIHWVIARGMLAPDEEQGGNYTGRLADSKFREHVKAYKFANRSSTQGLANWVDVSGVAFNTIHANTVEFYYEVNAIVQKEPQTCFSMEMLGEATAIGVQKGKDFSPTGRKKDLLVQAVAAGNAIARSMAFEPRDPACYIYGKENSKWITAFIGGDYRFLVDGGDGGLNLDARTFFFYLATVNTPAMVMQIIGAGSQYAMAMKDSDGDFFEGSKTYKLEIPADVPAKNFWSLVVYDPQTRSMLQTKDASKVPTTGELSPGLNSLRSGQTVNADGSTTVYFGPELPSGVPTSNWIKTVAGKRWFVCLRLYGPLQPWYDGLKGLPTGWRPGEVLKA